MGKLFDSIYRGYPIGDLVLLQRPAPKALVEIGPLQLAAPEVPSAYWVVDGQQRITALVGGLTASADTVDPRFRIYFDVQTERFLSAGRRERIPVGWFPVSAALNYPHVITWQREHPLWDDVFFDRLYSLVDAISDYEIPAAVIYDDDLSSAREIFERLNTSGKALRSAEVFSALFSVSDEMEPSGLQALAASTEAFGFGRLSDSILMQTVLSIRADDMARDFSAEFASDEDRRESFFAAERAIGHVIDFLRDYCMVPHMRLVPYPQYIPILARYTALFGPPMERAAELLRRWVWRCAVTGLAARRKDVAWRASVKMISGDPVVSASRLLEGLAHVDDSWTPDLDRTVLNNAQAKLNLLALLVQHPKLFVDMGDARAGEDVDIVTVLEARSSPFAVLTPASLVFTPEIGGAMIQTIPSGSEGSSVPLRELARDKETGLSRRGDETYEAPPYATSPQSPLSGYAQYAAPPNSLARRIVHPPYPHDRLLAAVTSGNLAAETLWSQCIDADCVLALHANDFDSFWEIRANLMLRVIRRNVQRYALFGFRDGQDPKSLFDDEEVGSDDA